MCESLSTAGVIFWAIGIAIALAGARLMEAAHQDNVKRAREDVARKAADIAAVQSARQVQLTSDDPPSEMGKGSTP